jgi:hypothetical protein
MSPQTSDGNPHTPTTKSLAIPAPGRRPTFYEVANIALVSAAVWDQSVCVMCLTQEVLERWLCRLGEFPAPVALLEVLNTNRATLNDWEAFLSSQTYDITVLHGVQSELRAKRLSCGYVRALIDAVPSGLVVMV